MEQELTTVNPLGIDESKKRYSKKASSGVSVASTSSTSSRKRKERTHQLQEVCYSPDGSKIVSCGARDKGIHVWCAQTGAQLLTCDPKKGHTDWVRSIDVYVSADGSRSRIVSGSDDTTIKVWDMNSGSLELKLEGHSNYVWSVAFSPDGSRIVSGSRDKTICVWDAKNGKKIHEITGHENEVNSVAFSPDGASIVSASDDDSVCIWSAKTGRRLQKLIGHTGGCTCSVDFSPDGKFILSGAADKTIRIWSAETGDQLREIKTPDKVRAVSFSSDGSRIVAGHFDGSISVWNASSGSRIFELLGHTYLARSVKFSPDGSRIISGSPDDCTLRVWNISTQGDVAFPCNELHLSILFDETLEKTKSLLEASPELSQDADGFKRMPLQIFCKRMEISQKSKEQQTLSPNLDEKDLQKVLETLVNLNPKAILIDRIFESMSFSNQKLFFEILINAGRDRKGQGDKENETLTADSEVKEMTPGSSRILSGIGMKTMEGRSSKVLIRPSLLNVESEGSDENGEHQQQPAAGDTDDVDSDEVLKDDLSLGKTDELYEGIMASFREKNVKDLEANVEKYTNNGCLDLFAWQQFLELYHQNDSTQFVEDLALLFDATWRILVVSNRKVDAASKSMKKAITDAVEKYSLMNHSERKNLLPELLANHGNALQRLAATKLFRFYLDSHMKSGVMQLYYLEVSMFLLFSYFFYKFSIDFKHAESWEDLFLYPEDISWDNNDPIASVFNIPFSFLTEPVLWCLSLAIYFLLRELAQFWALMKLGVHMSWFDDFWNVIDVMASAGTITLYVFGFYKGPGANFEMYASFISIFVWMKVLGYAKARSQPIATFVLMLSQILRDLTSFLSVLLIIIFMFGHAFYLVLSPPSPPNQDEYWNLNHTHYNSTVPKNPNNYTSGCWHTQNYNEVVCFTNTTNTTGITEVYFEPPSPKDVIDGDGDISFSTPTSTAFSLYLMVLGTFEPSAIVGFWANTLFFCYSFLVVIILLNVLIAIVSDSYDDVLVKSSELFWISRTNLIAEITSTFGWALTDDSGANFAMRTRFFVGKMKSAWKDNLKLMYGFSVHKWSNKNNKLALLIRILLSPIIVGFTILFPLYVCFAMGYPMILSYFPLICLDAYKHAKNRGARGKGKGLDLSIEADSSDWSGKVLDIVRRVNKQTSSESNKTNDKIKSLTEDVDYLKKKLDESEEKREEMLLIMLEIRRDQVKSRRGGETEDGRGGG
ncbi:hypothetical protein TrST_g9414 [Triparma strigata]|uniref:Ion transport domain-containing protein n=1 Tax=Triparma strigata TaxID=1606541 RepID=A0A9W7B4V6_9STRA|nr:hypothetical protein TrST_g9414 [Triparma strigata]